MAKKDLNELIGQTVEVKIEKVVYGGDGLVRMDDGTVLMLPYVLPDEVVKAEIEKARKNLLRGKVVDVVSASSDRTEPGCQYFGRCGGCQYQHMTYRKQCEIKQEQVGETLSRLGKLADEDVAEALKKISPSPKEYGYRNRIVLHWNGGDGYGYFGTDNKTVIPIEECPIANEEINSQIANIKELDLVPGQMRLTLLGFRPEWVNTTKDEINVSLLEKVFTFNPRCFVQANMPVFEEILKYMLDMEQLRGEVLVELYCGIGMISILAADRFDKVFGYDINSDNIGYARRNLERHSIKNIRFSTADALEGLKGLSKRGLKPDTILLDPPREGIGADVIGDIKSLAPKNIVYVSCDPATFTRDVVKLSEDYSLVSVKPFDMFPQTAHIEVVGVLRKR